MGGIIEGSCAPAAQAELYGGAADVLAGSDRSFDHNDFFRVLYVRHVVFAPFYRSVQKDRLEVLRSCHIVFILKHFLVSQPIIFAARAPD